MLKNVSCQREFMNRCTLVCACVFSEGRNEFQDNNFFLPPNIIEENSYMEYIKYRWKQYLLYYVRVGYGQ